MLLFGDLHLKIAKAQAKGAAAVEMNGVSTDAGDGQDQENQECVFHAFQCVVTTSRRQTL